MSETIPNRINTNPVRTDFHVLEEADLAIRIIYIPVGINTIKPIAATSREAMSRINGIPDSHQL
jgi:hypothetical protein